MHASASAPLLALPLLAAAPQNASAVTVGEAVVDRARGDACSDFAMIFPSIAFIEGAVAEWSVCIERIDGADARIGLMAPRAVDGGAWKVEAPDVRAVGLGVNDFTGLSLGVESGWAPGAFMADAEISYDLLGARTSGDDDCSSNGALVATPSVGTETDVAGATDRACSIKAGVTPAPLPAGAVRRFGRKAA